MGNEAGSHQTPLKCDVFFSPYRFLDALSVFRSKHCTQTVTGYGVSERFSLTFYIFLYLNESKTKVGGKINELVP